MTTALRGITWEHARGYGSVVAAAAAYAEVAPDVRIDWEFRSLQAFADYPIEDLVERYDLLVVDHPHIPLAAEAGLFARLDGTGHDDELATLARQSVGRSHASYAVDGQQYGLATDAAAQVAAYRPDLIANPPRDWPAVLELAREGRVLWPGKPIDAFSSLVTVAANSGAEPMLAGQAFLSEAEALAALDLLHELAAHVPAENLEWNPIRVADELTSGEQFVYSPLLFGYTNYSRVGFRDNRLRYIDIPTGSAGVAGSLLGGAGIAVSARSSNRSAAIDHAFWLASAEVQAGAYFDGGGQPGNAVAWESDRTNELTLDFFRGTRATLEGAYLRPRHPGYIALQDAASPLVTQALRGELADEAAVRALNDLTFDLIGGGA
ncbi:MAG TPA: extracellular solute-binding protein [Galbitalea sp.]|jgi:multiple sugar transport system substrate-binding protein|nr:extracellular solute-binding protein [Galbitalea sp.]